MPEPSALPTRKVTAGALGGALATVIVGVATWLGAPDPPVGLEGGLVVVLGFLASYFTTESE